MRVSRMLICGPARKERNASSVDSIKGTLQNQRLKDARCREIGILLLLIIIVIIFINVFLLPSVV